MPALPDAAKAWLDDKTFVTVATVNDDGSPQLSVLWAKRDGDDVLLSTIKGRRKFENWSRDPRVSVLVPNPANPYEYVEVRGTVTMTDGGGDDLISELSGKYRGVTPYPRIGPDEVRVVVRVHAEHVVDYR
jgi:PPOX class probable F420-dependent enzyme